jgi:hypothetical protein
MSDLQQQIDDLKTRHQDDLKNLVQSHNDQLIALNAKYQAKLNTFISDKTQEHQLLIKDDMTPRQKQDAIAQINHNFNTKVEFMNKEKQEEKKQLIKQHNLEKDELKKKQQIELRNLKNSKETEEPQDSKPPKDQKKKKNNENNDDKAYWEYHILTFVTNTEVSDNNCYDSTFGKEKHNDMNHGNFAWKRAIIFIKQVSGKNVGWFSTNASYSYQMWYVNNKGVMTYGQYEDIDTKVKGIVDMAYLRKTAIRLAHLKIPIEWNVKSPISDRVKYISRNLESSEKGWCKHSSSIDLQITSRRFEGQPGGNGNGEEQEEQEQEENPEKKKKKKKYSLYEFKYDIVITYDDGNVVKEPNKRIGRHENELKIYLQDGPFGTSWYEDVTSYTYMKLRSEKTKKITYSKKEYVSETPIASRRLVMIGVNQVKEVRIENVRKVKTIPCDQIINEDLMKILPYTSKLMTAGKATLESKIWSNFLVDKIFGGLLQERDLYDIPELTQEHCMNYVSNIDRSSNPDDFNDLLKSTEDNGEEELSPEDNIYHKIVNANNNVLNLPARIIEQGEPVIKIPFGILFNFEMEADNDMKRFIAHFQQGAILAQQEIFGFITDFIVKTLTDNLPSLGAVTQGVLIPIEEKAQSDKPQSQSYFVPTTPVATAVTASMQIAAIETIAQGTITTITGGLISGNLLVVMASQVTALIVEFLGLPGLNLVVVAAGQAVLATVKSLVYVLGEVIGKVAARVITWTLIALMDIVIVGAAVIVTQALRKPMTISDYAFILGINYGKPPDLHFFGVNQLSESDSHQELIEASKQFKENTGKKYDRVIGYAIPKDLKTQPINKKEIGAVIDLTNDNAIVISGKELKMLYALQFMYLFENVEGILIPDKPCLPLPPISNPSLST